MRLFLPIAAALWSTTALAQATPPSPGTDVDRVTMQPGDTKSFTLAPGNDHQLLHETSASTPEAITISYRSSPGSSTITATSHTGEPLMFTVLADPGGNDGFAPAGDISFPRRRAGEP